MGTDIGRDATGAIPNNASPEIIEQEEDGHIEGTFTLIQQLLDSVRKGVEMDCLETAISSLQDALDNETQVGHRDSTVPYRLMSALLTRYGLYGWIEDLDDCFGVLARFRFTGTEVNESTIEVIAAQLTQVCRSSINIDVLNTVICVATETLSSYADKMSAFQKASLLISLGKALVMRYLNLGSTADFERASTQFQEAERLATGNVPLTCIALTSLRYIGWLMFIEFGETQGCHLVRHYMRQEMGVDREGHHPFELAETILRDPPDDDADLNESIALLRISLHYRMGPHPRRQFVLYQLARGHFIRFKRRKDVENLDESISLHRQVLDLRPKPHPKRTISLNDLARVLLERFDLKGTLQDIDESLKLRREALDLTPKQHPDHPVALYKVANTLKRRFDRKSDLQDLRESIDLYQSALKLLPPLHPNRSIPLMGLGNAIIDRFNQFGSLQDVEKSIGLFSEALNLLPAHHSHHILAMVNLATARYRRFEENGSFQDLEDCISLYRRSLDLKSTQDSNRSAILCNLAGALLSRYRQKRALQELEDCILLFREALSLQSATHPYRAQSLTNLALALTKRFERNENSLSDLNEAISLHREALDLRPPLHPLRPVSLSNLATALCTRVRKTKNCLDLDEGIAMHREALELLPPLHRNRSSALGNLASSLARRFDQTGVSKDLEESILCHREALDLEPVPHPDRCGTLMNLAMSLLRRWDQNKASIPRVSPFELSDSEYLKYYGDIYYASQYVEEACKYETGPLITRLEASQHWADNAEARLLTSDEALDAYQYAMELLPQLASLDLSLRQRQDILEHSRDLVGKAAQCAVSSKRYDVAVVFLSAGHSIFWFQALQLRTPVDELIAVHPTLAESFIAISKQLESASYSHDSFIRMQQSGDNHTSLLALVDRRRRIIEEIRRIPGFARFLLPPLFSSLQVAAEHGPVVLLNASEISCDALIIRPTGTLTHVPLLDIRIEELQELKFLIHALLTTGLRSLKDLSSNRISALQSLMGRDLVRDNKSVLDQDPFRSALECLWMKVVRPVVEVLKIDKTYSPGRLWWCPTGPFAALPIHAAGIYSDNNKPIDCLFEYAVSSYCTSLQDLLHRPPEVTKAYRMTVIIEPEAAGAAPLPATRKELTEIEKHVTDRQHLYPHAGSKSATTRVDNILSDIQKSSFVHFGCHGMQNLENPLESYLLLSGSRLTMSRIIQECRVQEGALAYLSACETAKGDESRPDESLNLVATMMFAGFRSFVGTLWTIFDDDAPVVADVFYGHLFRNGKEAAPDVRDAARGLHLATKQLRDFGKPFYSWVPYVHYGIQTLSFVPIYQPRD